MFRILQESVRCGEGTAYKGGKASSDETASHSTRLANNVNQVAGYAHPASAIGTTVFAHTKI
jgi:hypothetical protein